MIPERLAAWADVEGVPSLCVPSGLDRPALVRALEELPGLAPDLVLVDVFPRGVLGELLEILGEVRPTLWLVSRRVNPRFYAEAEVARAMTERYERVIWCEEPPRELAVPDSLHIEPVVIRDPAECLSRAEAREVLGLPQDQPLLLGLGSGSADEQWSLLRLLAKVGGRLRRRGRPRIVFVSQRLPAREDAGLEVRALYPAMRYLRAADVVVGGGGYAAFHETRALGLPAVYVARARRYDDQAWRVREEAAPSNAEDLERAITERLSEPEALPLVPAVGASQIATLVAEAAGAAAAVRPRPTSLPA